jgi:hypothetical protein
MFWLSRNRLAGSYLRLSTTSRYFSAPYAASIGSGAFVRLTAQIINIHAASRVWLLITLAARAPLSPSPALLRERKG